MFIRKLFYFSPPSSVPTSCIYIYISSFIPNTQHQLGLSVWVEQEGTSCRAGKKSVKGNLVFFLRFCLLLGGARNRSPWQAPSQDSTPSTGCSRPGAEPGALLFVGGARPAESPGLCCPHTASFSGWRDRGLPRMWTGDLFRNRALGDTRRRRGAGQCPVSGPWQ